MFRRIGIRKYTSDMFETSTHSGDCFASSLRLLPGISMIGRPGIRLPYLGYYGLHYLIEEERIMIVLMPAKGAVEDLRRFADHFDSSLRLLKRLLG